MPKKIKPPQYNPDDVAFYPAGVTDEFLQQVSDVVCLDREADYGDGIKRMAVAGAMRDTLASLYPVDIPFAHEHILSMLVEKITRAACNPDKADTWIDIAGYARFGHKARRQ